MQLFRILKRCVDLQNRGQKISWSPYTKFGDVENDVQTNQDMILSTNDELNSKFLFLANYTDQAVANIDNHLTAEMDTLEQEQNNANLVLGAEDEKLAVSLNQTQVKIETNRLN